MKRICRLIMAAGLVLGIAQVAVASSVPVGAAPLVSAATADYGLQFDTDFNVKGSRLFWLDEETGWNTDLETLRVFPWVETYLLPPTNAPIPVEMGYYVAARQWSTDEAVNRLWLLRVQKNGEVDHDYGLDGWKLVGYGRFADVAAGAHGEIYMLDEGVRRVYCMRLDTDLSCFPNGVGLLDYPLAGTNPYLWAKPTRLLYDKTYGLFIAGTIGHTTRGTMVAVSRMTGTAGSTGTSGSQLVTTFGTNGHVIGAPSWSPATGLAASVQAMALRNSGGAANHVLYIGGSSNAASANNQTDGFVHSLSPSTGAMGAINWRSVDYEKDNNPSRYNDAVTALTVAANGDVVFAGWSESMDADITPMLMGRIRSTGAADLGFCSHWAQVTTVGVCLVDPPLAYGMFRYSPSANPVSVIERSNGDLVVLSHYRDFEKGSQRHMQVQQFSADGNWLYSELEINPDSPNQVNIGKPVEMVATGVEKDHLTLVGGQLPASSSSVEMAVAVLKGGDAPHVCLFAGGFEETESTAECW